MRHPVASAEGTPRPDARRDPHRAGPAVSVLTAAVAQRYYLDGASKSEIAAQMGLSRFKVARLVERARATGLVRIELDYAAAGPGSLDLELSARLRAAFGLRYSVVVDCAETDDAGLRNALGAAAAELLAEIMVPDDVLGMACSRSSMAMRTALTSLAPHPIVQLTGGLRRRDADPDASELVRDIARTCGGAAYFYSAPMVATDAAQARRARADPQVARAFGRFAEVTKAVVAVGAWQKGQSTVADAVTPREWLQLHDLGVRAELGGISFDAHGNVLTTPLGHRHVGIGAEQLRAVPDVIALVYGGAKAGAVRAAIRGGLINSVVTHSLLARQLLAGIDDQRAGDNDRHGPC